MQLADGIKQDIKAARRMRVRLPWWGVLCGIAASFVSAWLFDHFGRLALALPTLNSVGVLAFATALKWRLRRHAWFWGTIAALAALHVPLVLLVPWTAKWVPALAIGAIDAADLIAILAILALVGRFVGGPETSEVRVPRRERRRPG